jgi:hypothetical protein
LGWKVKLPEAVWMAGNDPLSKNPPLKDDENEWLMIGMPGGANTWLMVQLDPRIVDNLESGDAPAVRGNDELHRTAAGVGAGVDSAGNVVRRGGGYAQYQAHC